MEFTWEVRNCGSAAGVIPQEEEFKAFWPHNLKKNRKKEQELLVEKLLPVGALPQVANV